MMYHALFFGLGPMEIGITVLAIIGLFGGTKIKEFARTVSGGIKEITDVKKEIQNEVKDGMDKINPLK